MTIKKKMDDNFNATRTNRDKLAGNFALIS